MGEDWSCEKDLKLVAREFHKRGGITEGTIGVQLII